MIFLGATANLATLMAMVVGVYLVAAMAWGHFHVTTLLQKRSNLGGAFASLGGDHMLGPGLTLAFIAWCYVPLPTSPDAFLIAILVGFSPRVCVPSGNRCT